MKVRNQKPDQAATVVVKENLYLLSTWSVLRKRHEFTKEDARTSTFHFGWPPRPKRLCATRCATPG